MNTGEHIIRVLKWTQSICALVFLAAVMTLTLTEVPAEQKPSFWIILGSIIAGSFFVMRLAQRKINTMQRALDIMEQFERDNEMRSSSKFKEELDKLLDGEDKT